MSLHDGAGRTRGIDLRPEVFELSWRGLGGGSSEDASALIGAGFAPEWDHKSLGELFEPIRTTMPQFDVGRRPNLHQTADILAFMLYRGGYPAGTAELPTEAEALRIYRFLSVKPKA